MLEVCRHQLDGEGSGYHVCITMVIQGYHIGIPKVDCRVSPDIGCSKLHVVCLVANLKVECNFFVP